MVVVAHDAFGWMALRLLRERRAAVALIFCLVLVPLLGLIGLAVDFGFITQAKAQLDLAADTAALTATTTAASAYLANKPNYIALGQAAGQQWFAAQVGLLMDSAEPTTVAPVITVTQDGGSFTTKISYTARVGNIFGRLFGISTSAVSGTSVTMLPTNPYVNVAFLLDNSASTLLASTEGGIQLLNTLTQNAQAVLNVPGGLGGQPCAFACHWDSGDLDYYGLAKGKLVGSVAALLNPSGQTVQLRFDVTQSAVAASIQTMQTFQQVPDQYSLTVFTFNTDATLVFPAAPAQLASTDLAGGLAAVQAIDIPVVTTMANTNFARTMATLDGLTTPAGDGSTAASPRKALIIVTDGMEDTGNQQTGIGPGATLGPVDPANCQAMKNKGYAVYVLYTTYSSDPSVLVNDQALGAYLTPEGGASTMAQRLEACASQPANFIQASDPADIQAAMRTLLQSALTSAGRFTQ
jgi:Flp pilus assembly protein TadG